VTGPLQIWEERSLIQAPQLNITQRKQFSLNHVRKLLNQTHHPHKKKETPEFNRPGTFPPSNPSSADPKILKLLQEFGPPPSEPVPVPTVPKKLRTISEPAWSLGTNTNPSSFQYFPTFKKMVSKLQLPRAYENPLLMKKIFNRFTAEEYVYFDALVQQEFWLPPEIEGKVVGATAIIPGIEPWFCLQKAKEALTIDDLDLRTIPSSFQSPKIFVALPSDPTQDEIAEYVVDSVVLAIWFLKLLDFYKTNGRLFDDIELALNS